MPWRFGQRQHRRETRIAAFEAFAPERTRLRLQQRRDATAQRRPIVERVLARRIDIVQTEPLQQLGIELRLDRAEADVAVGAFEDVVERRGAEEEIARRIVAPGHRAAALVDERREGGHAIDHRRIDHLPAAAAVLLSGFEQCADDAEGEEHRAAAHVADERGRDHRRFARPAGQRHRARQRDVVDVVAGRLRKRAMLAPTGDPSIDELRVACRHGIGAESQALHHAGAKAFDQHVGAFDQRPGHLAAALAFQIERHRSFAAVLVGARG